MSVHFSVAVFLSAVIYFLYSSWKWAAVCFIACFYTDADHLYEYVLVNGWQFDIKNMISGQYFVELNKRYLWFHSYETLILVWGLALWFKRKPFAVAFSLGFLSHLMIDQFSYPLKPLAYFLTYRWMNGFSIDAFGS